MASKTTTTTKPKSTKKPAKKNLDLPYDLINLIFTYIDPIKIIPSNASTYKKSYESRIQYAKTYLNFGYTNKYHYNFILTNKLPLFMRTLSYEFLDTTVRLTNNGSHNLACIKITCSGDHVCCFCRSRKNITISHLYLENRYTNGTVGSICSDCSHLFYWKKSFELLGLFDIDFKFSEQNLHLGQLKILYKKKYNKELDSVKFIEDYNKKNYTYC